MGSLDNKGALKTLASVPSLANLKNFGLRPNQAYPDPKDFKINPAASPDNPKSHPYDESYTPGLIFRHELAHHDLITEQLEDGQAANFSEYAADTLAMEGIRKAWEKLQQQGNNPLVLKYLSNSLLFFAKTISRSSWPFIVFCGPVKLPFKKSAVLIVRILLSRSFGDINLRAAFIWSLR